MTDNINAALRMGLDLINELSKLAVTNPKYDATYHAKLVTKLQIINAALLPTDAALSAQSPVVDAELAAWFHEFVRMYQGTMRNQYCDGRPIGKWIVERLMAKTESPSEVATQSPVAVDEIDLVGTNLNDACWAFVEAMPHELPGPIFNTLKPAVKAAIEKYLALALPAKSAEEVPDRPLKPRAKGWQQCPTCDKLHAHLSENSALVQAHRKAELEEVRRETLEEAARIVEEGQETFTCGPSTDGETVRHLTKRSRRNMAGLAYAAAIRSLAQAQPTDKEQG